MAQYNLAHTQWFEHHNPFKLILDGDNQLINVYVGGYGSMPTRWFSDEALNYLAEKYKVKIKDLEPAVTQGEHLCTCSSYDIFNFGCKCGGK